MADKKITELTTLNTPTPLTKFVVAESGDSFQIPLGTIATNLPNMKSSGVIGVGVSEPADISSNVLLTKTLIRLNLSQGDNYELPAGFIGEVKFFVSENTNQQVVIFDGHTTSTAILNSAGSTLGLIYTGEKWAVISAFNTSIS